MTTNDKIYWGIIIGMVLWVSKSTCSGSVGVYVCVLVFNVIRLLVRCIEVEGTLVMFMFMFHFCKIIWLLPPTKHFLKCAQKQQLDGSASALHSFGKWKIETKVLLKLPLNRIYIKRFFNLLPIEIGSNDVHFDWIINRAKQK